MYFKAIDTIESFLIISAKRQRTQVAQGNADDIKSSLREIHCVVF